MVLLLLAVASAAPETAASQPAPPPQNGAALVLQLHDPFGLLAGPPAVRVIGHKDAPLRPVDDGTGADPVAEDGVYSAPMDPIPAGVVSLEVLDGVHAWRAGGKHDGGHWLWARLHGETVMAVGEAASVATADEAPAPRPPRPPGGSAPVPGGGLPRELAPEAVARIWSATRVVWAVVGAALAAGLGWGFARGVRSASGRAAAVEGLPPLAPAAATRLVPLALPAAVDALGAVRLLVVGPVPPGLPAGCRPFRVEDGALPAEVVAAAAELALRPGPPVALLVTDAARLDHPAGSAPLAALEAAVAGRFPLLVVDQGAGTA